MRERLPVPDAEIYLQDIAFELPDAAILDRLIAETAWRQETVTVWGKQHRQPRLTAWHGDPNARYRYSGIDLEPKPWTELLQVLRTGVEQAASARFNSVLLNYYRDHNDRMGLHSDNEPELGPVIASLSFGAARTFVFKARGDKKRPPIRVPLGSGRLLVMQGETQRHWRHGIDKQARPCGPRVNLTFRQVKTPSS